MHRTLALVATLAVVVVGLGALAAPAGAAAAVNVTPSTNIDDGTVVTVSWTGFAPNGTPSIVQCKNAPTTGAGGADCEFLTLQVSADGSNGAGAGSDSFVVHDTNGLALLNDRTEVKCDTTNSGAILVVDNPNDPASGAYKTITCTGSSVVTSTHTLLSCTGVSSIANLTPTMTSKSAKYVKFGAADAVAGKNFEHTTNAPILADATTCQADSDIATDIAGTNSATSTGVAKPNPYDNQTAGAVDLHTTTTGRGTSIALDGSASCQESPQPGVVNSFAQAYPLLGKITMKFDETRPNANPLLPPVPIQMQAFVRLGHDPADPDSSHFVMTGTVIKGPGVGADLAATVRLVPTASTKNLNVEECDSADASSSSTPASIAQLSIMLADGADQDALVDPLTVTLTE